MGHQIYLTGFMGAGKTTVGQSLAQRLGWPFVDLDRRVEARAGCSVAALFAQHGEPYFRDLEHRCLQQVGEEGEAVVALGGGAFVAERNRNLVRSAGTSVWLRPSFRTLRARLRAEDDGSRPLLRETKQLRALYQGRRPAYAQADHQILVADVQAPRDVADRIVSLLRGSTGCAT